MERKILVALTAAFLLGGVLPVQGSAADDGEIVEQTQFSARPESTERRMGHTMEERELHLFPQLDVVDHHRVLRTDGRVFAWGSYPEITVRGNDYPVLARILRNWSLEQKEAWENAAEDMQEIARTLNPSSPYFDYTVVDRWGRIDDEIVSFALRSASYSGGAHPMHEITTVHFNVETGEPVSINEIITGRDILLRALADAFRKQYPNREDDLYTHDIDEELSEFHGDGTWQEQLTWMLDAHNDLVVFYNPYEIGPYSAGSFQLTVTRAAYPEVFRWDMEE